MLGHGTGSDGTRGGTGRSTRVGCGAGHARAWGSHGGRPGHTGSGRHDGRWADGTRGSTRRHGTWRRRGGSDTRTRDGDTGSDGGNGTGAGRGDSDGTSSHGTGVGHGHTWSGRGCSRGHAWPRTGGHGVPPHLAREGIADVREVSGEGEVDAVLGDLESALDDAVLHEQLDGLQGQRTPDAPLVVPHEVLPDVSLRHLRCRSLCVSVTLPLTPGQGKAGRRACGMNPMRFRPQRHGASSEASPIMLKQAGSASWALGGSKQWTSLSNTLHRPFGVAAQATLE